jgi:hypothetical protein
LLEKFSDYGAFHEFLHRLFKHNFIWRADVVITLFALLTGTGTQHKKLNRKFVQEFLIEKCICTVKKTK